MDKPMNCPGCKERDERIGEFEKSHRKDCCCARSWQALGVTGYDGKSIPEHIDALRAEVEELKKRWERYKQADNRAKEIERTIAVKESYRLLRTEAKKLNEDVGVLKTLLAASENRADSEVSRLKSEKNAAVKDERERCVHLCIQERVDYKETLDDGDRAYNQAIDNCIRAIEDVEVQP